MRVTRPSDGYLLAPAVRRARTLRLRRSTRLRCFLRANRVFLYKLGLPLNEVSV